MFDQHCCYKCGLGLILFISIYLLLHHIYWYTEQDQHFYFDVFFNGQQKGQEKNEV